MVRARSFSPTMPVYQAVAMRGAALPAGSFPHRACLQSIRPDLALVDLVEQRLDVGRKLRGVGQQCFVEPGTVLAVDGLAARQDFRQCDKRIVRLLAEL